MEAGGGIALNMYLKQDSCIAVFAANLTTGALTFVGSFPLLGFAPGGEGASGIAVDGSGAFPLLQPAMPLKLCANASLASIPARRCRAEQHRPLVRRSA